MSDDECTTCDGDGGWWVTVPPQRAVGRIRCEHCEGTGVEPEPTDVAALTDAELVAHVEAADIEGHIKTDVSAL